MTAARPQAPEQLPLVVIAHEDPPTAEGLRHAVEAGAGWRATVAAAGQAGLAAALTANPAALLVGCGRLAELPPACRIPVLAVGDDRHPGDLRAALAAGAKGLLSWPDGAADLPGELARVVTAHRQHAPAEPPSLHVAVQGAHGGAGATTVAAHLAAAWARHGPRPVLLADLAGGLGFRLDLDEHARTWAALAPLAAELDGPTLVDTLSKPTPGLTVLPLPGLADGAPEPLPEPWVVQAVLEAARSVYSVVVTDLPPWPAAATAAARDRADVLVAVSRPESSGLQALHAILAAWAADGHDPQAAGAVVLGTMPRAPLSAREVRASLAERLWALIPYTPELAVANEDGLLLLDRPELPALQALLTLAHQVVPFSTQAPGGVR